MKDNKTNSNKGGRDTTEKKKKKVKGLVRSMDLSGVVIRESHSIPVVLNILAALCDEVGLSENGVMK